MMSAGVQIKIKKLLFKSNYFCDCHNKIIRLGYAHRVKVGYTGTAKRISNSLRPRHLHVVYDILEE